MDKSILLAAAAVVGIGTVATAYYMTPIEVAASETPSILVDASPATVISKIRTISMETYFAHAGAKGTRPLEEAQVFVKLSGARVISDTETAFDLMRDDDHLMQFLISVKPTADGKSEVDVQTLIGDSKLASNPAIHPYDIKLALSAADFMATDYVSSLLKGHPILTGKRLEEEMKKRYAKEADAALASMERIQETFLVTYAADLRQDIGNYAEATTETIAEYPDERDESDVPIGPSNAAEFAARNADDALDEEDKEEGW
jgi:hypothetical protein